MSVLNPLIRYVVWFLISMWLIFILSHLIHCFNSTQRKLCSLIQIYLVNIIVLMLFSTEKFFNVVLGVEVILWQWVFDLMLFFTSFYDEMNKHCLLVWKIFIYLWSIMFAAEANKNNRKNYNFISDFMSDFLLLSPFYLFAHAHALGTTVVLHWINGTMCRIKNPFWEFQSWTLIEIHINEQLHSFLMLFSLFQRIESFLEITNIKRFYNAKIWNISMTFSFENRKLFVSRMDEQIFALILKFQNIILLLHHISSSPNI